MTAYRYFDSTWRTDMYVCHRCGWSGNFDGMAQAFERERVEGHCPECAATLAVVLYPTFDELREAADSPAKTKE
ncbi:MAG: hypothetical protein HY791_31070 [Deltaproteobacteria bacterium]|nr:hypothetical protein [Deltaproteobacteria bacterium]